MRDLRTQGGDVSYMEKNIHAYRNKPPVAKKKVLIYIDL